MMKKFNASFFRHQQVFGLDFSVFSPLKTVNHISQDVTGRCLLSKSLWKFARMRPTSTLKDSSAVPCHYNTKIRNALRYEHGDEKMNEQTQNQPTTNKTDLEVNKQEDKKLLTTKACVLNHSRCLGDSDTSLQTLTRRRPLPHWN